MAPQVSLADDVAELSRAVGQLARLALAGRPPGQVEKAAAAAGLAAGQARAFLRGEDLLPPRQSVVFVNAVLEQARQQQVSYMTTLRAGHAGGDAMRASYAGTISEKITLPRGRTEDRVSVQGGPVEATRADVDATLARLAVDFFGWRFEVDGLGTLDGNGGAKPKLTWLARHPDLGQASGATSLELAGKVQQIELAAAAEAKQAAQYARG
jgi:hypothetical protein